MVHATSRSEAMMEWQVAAGGDLLALTNELNAVLDASEADDTISTLLIRLPLFSGDQSWPDWVAVTEDVSRWERAVSRLERSRLATIALLDGAVGGASLDLLLATTIRVAKIGAVLYPPVNDGLPWPGMGMFRFARETGVGGARKSLLWGASLDMPACLALNLVDEVTSSLESTLGAFDERAKISSPPEVSLRWNLIREGGASSANDALGMHLAACDRELRRLQLIGSH